MVHLPSNLAPAYDWIESAAEWSEALKDPGAYAKSAAENCRENPSGDPVTEADILACIDWHVTNYDPKVIVLARHLDCAPDEISEGYGDCEFEHGSQSWIVATDSEADSLAFERAKSELWAFNADHLSRYCSALDNPRARKAFDSMRESLCEDSQDFVEGLLGDRLDECVTDAISVDGRGHFLSGYDGEEIEAGPLYLYRVN